MKKISSKYPCKQAEFMKVRTYFSKPARTPVKLFSLRSKLNTSVLMLMH
jgi:hypothetical protein